MKKLIIIFVGMIIFSACAKQVEVVGTYHSAKPGYFTYHRYKLKGYRYFSGLELVIKDDSTFQMTTCGNIMAGNWFCKDDSLYIITKTNRWRNDSLQENGFNGTWPEILDRPFAMKIENGYLFKLTTMYDSPQRENPRKGFDYLVKAK
ncbi:MAG: hypothetical protein K9H64_01785 [Bacteroidales bacterium]|nr:hypothetical protein [Bacteroidales bacterium]MCF8454723.1 hypothetical protein [Bacteroidales bacterium]